MSEPNKYRPILFVTISSLASSDDARLRVALTEIAKQDPTIKIDAEAVDGRVVAAGMTQSHLEAIGDRLLHEYKLMVNVSEPNVTYLETIRKIGEAEGKYIRQTGGLGNYGHCKLRIEPNGPGKGY
jgi:elongation factor G